MRASGDLVIARDRVIGVATDSDQDAMVEHAIHSCYPERARAHATASRRTPNVSVPEQAVSGSFYETTNLTVEMRRCGENQKSTTEAQRHGEERRCSDFPDHPITCDYPITRSLDLCHPERVGAHATASRRTPNVPVPEQAVSGSFYETLKKILVAALHTIRATLREIFDESAYDRFLLRTHGARSVDSYRAFTRERDAAMVKKPRCC